MFARSLFIIAWSLACASAVHAVDTEAPPKLKKISGFGIPQGIVVRTTENVTKGGWVWLLNQCEALNIERIDLLVKQDEDNFRSARTGATLQSGDLLVPLPGEITAPGWEDAAWLHDMLARAKEKHIEVWAWWPCFHDSHAAAIFPQAAYTNKRGEKFVDPAVPEVRERQSALIAKLLENYQFNGISLDWVRYDGWESGTKGPLGAEFSRQNSMELAPGALDNGYTKARWYEMRARLIADWVRQTAEAMRTRHPQTRWGAFLLPWQFSEASQSYPMLGHAGLDFIQPMGYWNDWKLPPEWVGDRLLLRHRDLANGTAEWPVLGIDAPLEEITRALDHVPSGLCGGLSWFTFGSWEQRTFEKIRSVMTANVSARELLGYGQPSKLDRVSSTEIKPVPSKPSASARALKAKEFPEDSSIWSLVCLAELYKRGALDPKGDDPVAPVLAFHTFAEGPSGSQTYLYKCTTTYLDALLSFIKDAGFNVCPLSRLQGYLITRDPAYLPPRPLVLTLDDGSLSVKKLFHPRAEKYGFPYTLALVSDWLADTDKERHSTDERGVPDPDLTWAEAKDLYSTNLVEVVSHSDAMHYQTVENPAAQDEKPALVSRQFLKENNRTETNSEYLRRVRLDAVTSRRKLTEHGFRPPTIFCWPYGEWNQPAKSIAEQCGFTHFLLFDTPPVMASAECSRDGIPRIPVLRPDEFVPFDFPKDTADAQSWWLAFLKVGRDSCSLPLIHATLAQLTWEGQRTPEAELSRAVMDFLRGAAPSGMTRLLELRQAYPFDSSVTEAVDKTMRQFNPRPTVDTAH